MVYESPRTLMIVEPIKPFVIQILDRRPVEIVGNGLRGQSEQQACGCPFLKALGQ